MEHTKSSGSAAQPELRLPPGGMSLFSGGLEKSQQGG